MLLGTALVVFGFMAWKTYEQLSPKLNLIPNNPKHYAAMAATSGASAPALAASGVPAAAGPAAALPGAVGLVPAAAASAPKLAGCVAMRKRCECIGSDGLVMTVKLDACELNAGRTGADIPYAMAPTFGASDYLKRTPDLVPLHDDGATVTAALSPRVPR